MNAQTVIEIANKLGKVHYIKFAEEHAENIAAAITRQEHTMLALTNGKNIDWDFIYEVERRMASYMIQTEYDGTWDRTIIAQYWGYAADEIILIPKFQVKVAKKSARRTNRR